MNKERKTLLPHFSKAHNALERKFSWYKKWHLKPYAIKSHIGILIFFVSIIIIVFTNQVLTTGATESAPKEKIKKYNEIINSSLGKLEKNNSFLPVNKQETQNELFYALQERKLLLLSEIKDNPKILKEFRLSSDTYNRLPEEDKKLVEKEEELSGELIVSNVDYKGGKTKDIYNLKKKEGNKDKIYNLNFTEKQEGLFSKEAVSVRGLSLDNEVVLESSENPSLNVKVQAPLNVFGDQRTIIIMMNFLDDTSQPFTNVQADAEMFTDANSADEYFRETSYSQLSLSGDVVGWYTIPYNKASGCSYNDVDNWAIAADSAALAGGYNVNNYDLIAYNFPYSDVCGWAGLGELGGPRTWHNGWWGDQNELYAHELGHNLGAHHAAYEDCGALTIDDYANCTESEYGDKYDTMGYWNTFHFSAPHKASEGWLPSGRIQTVSSDGTYTIYPFEPSSSNIQALRIAKPDTSEYYYLEYRRPTGFDSALPAGITRGVIGHLFSDYNYTRTYLLDFTPGSAVGWADFDDSALSDGATFTDSANSISVTQVSHDANSVVVNIDFTSPQGHVLNGWGGILPFGGASTVTNQTHWNGWDIARDIALRSDGTSGYVLDGWGGVHAFGGAPAVSITGYWPGWDIARSIVLVNDTSGYVLNGWGGIWPFGGAPAMSPQVIWAGNDIARDIVLRSDNLGGYVLNSYGGVHAFGNAPAIANPSPIWWSGLARAMVLRDDTSGYVLNGWGGIHAFGGAPAIASQVNWINWDIARDFVLRSDKVSGYTLNGWGGIHAFGGAPNISLQTNWINWDIARKIQLSQE